MIKDRLRFLALGFFISALFLSAYEVLMPSSKAEVNNGQHAESTNDDINYKEQYESLLSEYEKLQATHVDEETNHSSETSDEAESDQATDSTTIEDSSNSDNVEEEQTVNNDVVIFTIDEGQPSSVVLQNLLNAGLIDDIESAQNYLEENNLTSKLQYGNYELSQDMGYYIILDAITME